MSDPRAEQLQYFLEEMAYLRDEGAAFASHYPGAAAALDIGPDRADDPQVERLLEAFAFITGRLQRNIDHQYPRLAGALLDVLYPHLTAPVPSVTMVEFQIDPTRARAAHDFVVPRGSQLIADTDGGAVCRFSTAWDTHLWPLTVAAVDRPDPALFPTIGQVGEAQSLLRLRLQCLGEESFPDALPDRLRLRLTGAATGASKLYEALLNAVDDVWVVDPAEDPEGAPAELTGRVDGKAVRLPLDALSPVGFDPEEALLPRSPAGNDAHRLVQEYFLLPQKFLFADLHYLHHAKEALKSPYVDILFVISAAAQLPTRLDPNPIKVNTVPAINLFRKVAEPIRVARTTTDYLIQPDLRLERSTEIYSVEQVTLTSMEAQDGEVVAPMYAFTHAQTTPDPAAGREVGDLVFWTAKRIPTRRPDMTGSDIHLSFLDNRFDPGNPAAEVAFVHALCTNRGLAESLSPGTRLRIEADAPVSAILCTMKPTPQKAPALIGESAWRLVSHLSINHLSLAEGDDPLATLRESLSLLAGERPKWAMRQIGGLMEMHTRRVARRVGEDAWRGFAQGLEITITLDEDAFDGSSGYLLGTVLSHYFGLCTAANSFTELAMLGKRRKEEWARWAPRTGAQIVV